MLKSTGKVTDNSYHVSFEYNAKPGKSKSHPISIFLVKFPPKIKIESWWKNSSAWVKEVVECDAKKWIITV